MVFHLNTASTEELESIPGIGQASAIKLLQHFRNEGNITSFIELTGLANKASFEGLKQMHRDGLMTSNIAEFRADMELAAQDTNGPDKPEEVVKGKGEAPEGDGAAVEKAENTEVEMTEEVNNDDIKIPQGIEGVGGIQTQGGATVENKALIDKGDQAFDKALSQICDLFKEMLTIKEQRLKDNIRINSQVTRLQTDMDGLNAKVNRFEKHMIKEVSDLQTQIVQLDDATAKEVTNINSRLDFMELSVHKSSHR